MTLAQAYKKQFGKVSYPFEVFDANGKLTYHEASNGYWSKSEYDANGNRTYYENSKGYWTKREYDSNSNETYYEDSDGVKRDKRKSSCDGKIVEIDGKKYKLKEL